MSPNQPISGAYPLIFAHISRNLMTKFGAVNKFSNAAGACDPAILESLGNCVMFFYPPMAFLTHRGLDAPSTAPHSAKMRFAKLWALVRTVATA